MKSKMQRRLDGQDFYELGSSDQNLPSVTISSKLVPAHWLLVIWPLANYQPLCIPSRLRAGWWQKLNWHKRDTKSSSWKGFDAIPATKWSIQRGVKNISWPSRSVWIDFYFFKHHYFNVNVNYLVRKCCPLSDWRPANISRTIHS